ncbi:MAG: hypothetical protein Q8K48_04350 [Candidatus Planktophila sp.]|nr:hypothetical protein [Candidatus Planktophila sp.]
MIRKILLGAFFLLNFATVAEAAQNPDEILYQSITQAEAEELNIEIPSNEPSGYKSLEVQISGMGKKAQFKRILFCKNIDGVIHWNNICEDLKALAAQTSLENASKRSELPKYDPFKNPKQTTNTAIVAFAALSVVTGAGALATQILDRSTPITPSESDSQGYLTGLSKGAALIATTHLGRGDKSKLWTKPINQKMDNLVTRIGNRISGFSPLATRILSDGNYQRSLIGPYSLLIYPFAIGLGIFSSLSLQQDALPPSLGLILMMMIVGTLDALAGLLASTTFALSVLMGGHYTDLNSVLTVAGVCLLAFSPALLAGAFRPFRRTVWDFTSLWERGTDYVVASVLTGWVVQQIVLGLPGLAGLQLPLTIHARTLALFAAGLVIVRFALEDLSTTLFPLRLIALQPSYRERTIAQQGFAAMFKVIVFGVVAGKFIGISIALVIGVILFSLPLLMGIFEDRFPKSEKIERWMPTGIIEMLVMTISGYFIAIAIQDRYPNARTYVLTSFVILSLPGFTLKILALFGKEGAKDWRITRIGKLTYRVVGVMALSILIYIVMSGLLISNTV